MMMSYYLLRQQTQLQSLRKILKIFMHQPFGSYELFGFSAVQTYLPDVTEVSGSSLVPVEDDEDVTLTDLDVELCGDADVAVAIGAAWSVRFWFKMVEAVNNETIRYWCTYILMIVFFSWSYKTDQIDFVMCCQKSFNHEIQLKATVKCLIVIY